MAINNGKQNCILNINLYGYFFNNNSDSSWNHKITNIKTKHQSMENKRGMAQIQLTWLKYCFI